MKRKICVITGTRAEYGLLYWLIKEIQDDIDLDLQLIVTGMHLSPEFGLTYKEIEKEFKIDKKIEILLSSDSEIGVAKSMGLAQISFAETYNDLKPDIVVVLGDRYEIFSAISAAMICKIPVAHIDGGEITVGAFDDSVRHCLTKMSQIHFVSEEEYKKRVIQLGENPSRVFNVGPIFLDNILNIKLLSKNEFEESINFKLNKQNILVTYHPETLCERPSKEVFENILDIIDNLKDTNIIFTKANCDTEGRLINQLIDEYVAKNSIKSCCFTSLGQLRYLSALKYVDCVVGNSSSGVTEAPYFKTATINIGDRQAGRIRYDTIIDCENNLDSILNAFKKVFSSSFSNNLKKIERKNITMVSKKIVLILKTIDLKNILQKTFYDIKF